MSLLFSPAEFAIVQPCSRIGSRGPRAAPAAAGRRIAARSAPQAAGLFRPLLLSRRCSWPGWDATRKPGPSFLPCRRGWHRWTQLEELGPSSSLQAGPAIGAA
eukprot:6667177-Pyramimonas_sp.AAC.1